MIVACVDIDGKYLFITGNRTRSLSPQKLQIGPIIHSSSSNEKHQCLQFWYSAYGQGQGKLLIVRKNSRKDSNDEIFMTNDKNQGKCRRENSSFFHFELV